MTASLMCVPSGRCQSNGTDTWLHCNCLPQLFQAIPALMTAPTTDTPGVAASAGDTNGSTAATPAKIAMSTNGTLRIMAPGLGCTECRIIAIPARTSAYLH